MFKDPSYPSKLSKRFLFGFTLLCLSLSSCAFKYEPNIEPLVLPTIPGSSLNTVEPGSAVNDMGASTSLKTDLKGFISINEEWLKAGTFVFSAFLAGLGLYSLLNTDFWTPCVITGLLTIVNAAGSLLVLTGVFSELGVVILIINLIIQLYQILSDREAMLQGEMSEKRFNFKVLLNIFDAIPVVGVFSGIFSLMGDCIFDWAFDWMGK
jgi:hypothetical protein